MVSISSRRGCLRISVSVSPIRRSTPRASTQTGIPSAIRRSPIRRSARRPAFSRTPPPIRMLRRRLPLGCFRSISPAVPISAGFRNQFNTGLQQAIGKILLIDADYFWKYTHNAYDFSTLLNTTITFPIAWHNSKLDGVTGRVSTTNLHGFQAYWTFGHTRARYFPPETGGLIPQGAPLAGGVFRIDHDQAFQSTVNLRYQRPKNTEWVALTYRFDSGLVVSGIPDAGAALGLMPNQQVSIGLACNGVYATATDPLSDCTLPGGKMGLVT